MRIPATLAITTLLLTPLAQAKEYPIGEPQQCGGMEVGAVYLQPVEMDPTGMMRAAAESDVHLEADNSATEENRNGWQEGRFVPYLQLKYRSEEIRGGKTCVLTCRYRWSPLH